MIDLYGKMQFAWNSFILLDEFQHTFLKVKCGLFQARNMEKLSGFYTLHVFYYGSTL
jgi:hypothetical protein